VNPAAILHDDNTRTFVNLLHSHGSNDVELAVDASLFDEKGICVCRRPAWRTIARHGVVRADIAELLPDPAQPFSGHIALSFAARPGVPLPRHLQALIEYRRPDSIARVMTWSDEWNSRVRLALRDRSVRAPSYRSYFRVAPDERLRYEFAITNAGHPGYDRCASVRVEFCPVEGERVEAGFELTPFETRVTSMPELFPELAASTATGIVLVESESDLACIGHIRHLGTGALAAEHFLWLKTRHEGELLLPSGS
jgi:hypothetical protein